MAWIREKIKVNEDFNPLQRQAVGQEVIDFIVKRSKNSRDKNGKPFPGYSDSYKKSLDFKIAGKTSKVNLTLSSEMLNSIRLLSHRRGEITIGFNRGDNLNNAKAEGNIKGTYGQKTPNPRKARDFLGISTSALETIERKYDLDRNKEQALERLAVIRELLNDDSSTN